MHFVSGAGYNLTILAQTIKIWRCAHSFQSTTSGLHIPNHFNPALQLHHRAPHHGRYALVACTA